MQKNMKVYEVETALLESGKDGGDIQNYSSYKLTAPDAATAIRNVERDWKFIKGEYVSAVRIITVLD